MRHYFELELTQTREATSFLNDRYRHDIQNNIIEFEASNYFIVHNNEELTDSIAYEFHDLNINFELKQDCECCNGEGTQEELRCINNSNECCGGCYHEIECEECGGNKTQEYYY